MHLHFQSTLPVWVLAHFAQLVEAFSTLRGSCEPLRYVGAGYLASSQLSNNFILCSAAGHCNASLRWTYRSACIECNLYDVRAETLTSTSIDPEVCLAYCWSLNDFQYYWPHILHLSIVYRKYAQSNGPHPKMIGRYVGHYLVRLGGPGTSEGPRRFHRSLCRGAARSLVRPGLS